MKRAFSIILSLVLILSLSGCATFTILPKEVNSQIAAPTQQNVPVASDPDSTEESAPAPIATEPTATEPTQAPTQPSEPPAEQPTVAESQPPAQITKAEAKAIALAHAKAEASAIRDYEIELERNERVPHYDISFDFNGKEYEYEIDLYSGEILKSHAEADDNAPAQTLGNITAAEAKAIAFAHAKVQESSVRDLEIEKETERKQTFYEISFHAGGYDYDYEIDASSGGVLHHEKELDD